MSKPIGGCIGWLMGLVLASSICAAADHLAHRSDALGALPEILLIVSLAVLCAFIGAAAA